MQNVGFDTTDSAHPAVEGKSTALIMAKDISFPLIHPQFFCIDPRLDMIYYKWRTRHGVFLKVIAQPIRWLDERLFNKKIIRLYKHIFAK